MAIKTFCCIFSCLLPCVLSPALAEEKEPSPPPWRAPPYPIVSLPITQQAPTIDGKVGFDEEWRDAVALTGCYQRDLDAIAPPQSQLVFLLKLGKEDLYVGAQSPVFPKGSGLRAFEKRPDHLAEIMGGDHMALEVLPLPGRNLERLNVSGHFAFVWNSLGTLSDQHYNSHPGQPGLEWTSKAEVRNRVTEDMWETEMRIPLERFKNATMARYLSLPPKGGSLWGLRIARRFGEDGANLFATWDNADLVIRSPKFNEVPKALSQLGRLKIVDAGVAVQLRSLGDLANGKLKTLGRLTNTDQTAAHSVTVMLHVQDSKGAKLWSAEETVKVAAGDSVPCPTIETELDLEPRGSRLFIKIVQDGKKTLYITPGLALIKFDASNWKQYVRSLEVLRE